MIATDCSGCLAKKFVPLLGNVLLKVLLNLAALCQTGEEVHDAGGDVVRVSNAAEDFVRLMALVAVIPLWVVAFLDPDGLICSFLRNKVTQLQLEREAKVHI